MTKGLLFDVARNSYVDGPGIRTTFFFKGCHLRCRWCHNPEGQRMEPEMMFFRDKCTGCGACTAVCTHPDGCILCGECVSVCSSDARKLAGKAWTPEKVLQIALQDKPFFDSTGGGVTCSGGECMLQIDFLAEVLHLLRKNGISTAVDTAGDVPWEYFERVLDDTNLFLYDVKCMDPALHREYTGIGNERLLDNLRRLLAVTPEKVLIRIPLIPGFNASVEEMGRIAAFLRPYGKTPELLPYHAMGESKALAVGKPLFSAKAPTKEETELFRSLF